MRGAEGEEMSETGTARKSHWMRWCALVGVALAVSSIVVANLWPIAPGDMSVFTRAFVASGLLLAGVLLVLIATVAWIVTAARRRSKAHHATA
jgi:hypothetical protein